MADCGYGYNTSKGENIAAGYSTAEAVFTGWKNSPGHDANMLNTNFTVIGIGLEYVQGSPYGNYWTTDFGGYVDPTAHEGGTITPVSTTTTERPTTTTERPTTTTVIAPPPATTTTSSRPATTTTTAPPQVATFSDVPGDQTFALEIYALAARGIVGGYDDGTYRPGDPVTRAQFAKIIGLSLVRQPLDAPPRLPSFFDVPYTGLLYPFAYVETAVDLGIIQGYDDGTFRPGNDMTRAQLALMLVRAGGNRLAQPFADFSDGFTDVPGFAADAVRIAKYNSLLSGVTPTTFNPDGRATRGQVAKVTYNLIVRLGL
jgi:hypothetical protein